MNSDVQTALIIAATTAAKVLGDPSASDLDRQNAKYALDQALVDISIEADFRTHREPAFNGPVYDPLLDDKRLRHQLGKIFEYMMPGHWRTLEEIAKATGEPQTSISAQLRHLRKTRFGSYLVEKRPRGDREHGIFEYRLLGPDGGEIKKAKGTG